MKKIGWLIIPSLFLAVMSLSGMSCPLTPSGHLVVGFFSVPNIYVTENGAANFSDVLDHVTGTDITNAQVTVKNETTGVSSTAAFVPATAPATHGFYQTAGEFVHSVGQQVSLRVISGGTTINGNATKTPGQSYTSVRYSDMATRPFTLSWTVTSTTEAATHTWVTLNLLSNPKKSYAVVVPISQTSLQVTNQEIPAGNYIFTVFGVNSMSLTGAQSGSVIYVGSTSNAAQSQTVTVN